MAFSSQEIRNVGKLITMGSLTLTMTLRLEKSEIHALNINFRRLKTLSDLNFLIENEILWERIELSSKNELLNILFHMNKIKRIKNIIAYIIYDKLKFNKEQLKFQRLLDWILLANGVVIYSYDIFRCKLNINFKIMYKNIAKKVVLYGDEDYDEEELNIDNQQDMSNSNDSILNNNYNSSFTKNNSSISDENVNNNNESISKFKNEKDKEKEDSMFLYEEDEEKSKESDNDTDIGLFGRLPENEINFNEFKYIYIHLKDYIYGGEFQDLFKLQEIYNFLKKIQNNSKIKIILNFTENLRYYGKYLIKFLKIADIHIFRKKAELVEILIKKKELENKMKEKKNNEIMELFKIKKVKLIKKIKIGNNRNENYKSSNNSCIRLNKLHKSSGEKPTTNSYRELENKSQSLKNILIKKSLNLTFDRHNKCGLDKNNIYDYIYELIMSSNSKILFPQFEDKLGIYLEDFKKIYITDYKKIKFRPITSEYDLNIYPKANVHSLKEIDRIRDILYSNYSKFSYMIYGCILSTILDHIPKGRDSYYLFYFYIRMSILKILSFIKAGTPIPTNRAFYVIQLKKNELNKIISDENAKKKENGFNMNLTHNIYKIKENDITSLPSMDNKFSKLGTSSMDLTQGKDLFSENNKFGGINIDINTMMTNQRFRRERNLYRRFWSKKNGTFSILGDIPQYAVYLTKKDRKRILKKKLPPIKIQKKSKIIENLISIKSKHDEDEKEMEKVDTTKYQEIKFQPTQKET